MNQLNRRYYLPSPFPLLLLFALLDTLGVKKSQHDRKKESFRRWIIGGCVRTRPYTYEQVPAVPVGPASFSLGGCV
jgi:hypothetical protein